MPGIAISGYMVGFCIKEGKEDQYGVVDLLQFGAKGQRSELVPLLVYDDEIRDWLKKVYEHGKIYPSSFLCSIVSIPGKKDILWIVERCIEYKKKDVRESNDGTGGTPTDKGNSSTD